MNTIEPEVSRLLCKINTIESLVDRVFRNPELTRGQICENPVTGGYYVGGEDPIGPQKRMVHCALLAREWFVAS